MEFIQSDDTVQTYPLNADKLQKGDTIDQKTIAEFLGVPLNSKAYELGVLALAAKVAKALYRVNRPCTVVVTRRTDPLGPGAIRVLTDEEALAYNGRAFKCGLRKSFRKHRKILEIDPSQLSSEGRKNFERTLVVQGAVLVSINRARYRAVLKAATRTTPPMFEHKSE